MSIEKEGKDAFAEQRPSPLSCPSIGRIVVLAPGEYTTSPAPAVITKVLSPIVVNLMVLPDNGTPFPLTSVELFENSKAVEGEIACHWPDRN